MHQDRRSAIGAPGVLSRRILCGKALVLGLGTPFVTATGLRAEDRNEKAKKKDNAEDAAEAKKKISKERAAYQDEPKGKANFCASCKFFNPPAGCQIVDGMVSPQGWCQLYEKKST